MLPVIEQKIINLNKSYRFTPMCRPAVRRRILFLRPHRIRLKACRNSGLNIVQMIGFNVELKQPSHKKKLINSGEMLHEAHVGKSIATIKNGSQQHTNAPVIIANVLAALRSRFDSADCWVFLRTNVGGRSIDEVPCDGYAIDSSAVGGSLSIRSTPLP